MEERRAVAAPEDVSLCFPLRSTGRLFSTRRPLSVDDRTTSWGPLSPRCVCVCMFGAMFDIMLGIIIKPVSSLKHLHRTFFKVVLL